MKPFTFDPQPSVIADLFAKWIPLYVAQRPMDDDEAEPYQDPLCKLETAVADQSITSLQDFFLHHTTQTCLGSMAADYSVETINAVCAIALAEAQEREALLALINEHIDNETRFCATLDEHDDDSPEFAAKGGDDLSTRGIELIHAIAMHPATSFEAILLKGRYLAARRARGDLSYEVAFAFVESFLDRAEGV